ncbi:MAG: dihydroneopterin aldolase [Bacteroidales bacterium]|nr:dihydroneopterin aldolase [Bacteroidales bacterium]
MGLIQIEGMEFFAYHGCFEEEQIIGNKFTVDISIETDLSEAAETDDLNKTINYQEVYNIVKNEMEVKSRLLENVAGRIIKKINSNFTSIKKVEIKISKINPQLGGKTDNVSVQMSSE